MYLTFVSTLCKIKVLLNSLRKYMCTTKLLTILTQLSSLIVILTLLKPFLKLGNILLKKLFEKKRLVEDVPVRKYKKLETLSDGCSKCSNSNTLSFSISKSDPNPKSCTNTNANASVSISASANSSDKKIKENEKNKKPKIKITKKEIKQTLRNFKLD